MGIGPEPFKMGEVDGYFGNPKNPGYHSAAGFTPYEIGDIRRMEYFDGYKKGREDLGKRLIESAGL